MPASSFITATDARKNLFSLLEKVKKSVYPFVIIHKGKPEAVLMSWNKYNRMIAKNGSLSFTRGGLAKLQIDSGLRPE